MKWKGTFRFGRRSGRFHSRRFRKIVQFFLRNYRLIWEKEEKENMLEHLFPRILCIHFQRNELINWWNVWREGVVDKHLGNTMSNKMGIETPMYPWLNVSSMGVTTEQQQLSFPRTVSPLLLLLIRWNESLRNPRFIIPASLNVPSPPLFSLFDKDQTIVPLPIKASTATKERTIFV